jgi:hypothetical protein
MNLKRHKIQFGLFCLVVIAVCAFFAQGQSGRRQPKPPPAAPVPTPTAEPSPVPAHKPKAPELNFLIASERNTTFESYPFSYYDAVMHGCGDRLRSESSASVDVAQNDVGRGEAIKKAKASTDTHVVLIRFELDRQTARSYDDLEIDFVMFAPKTGKVETSGRAYMTGARKGPLIVSPRTTGPTSALYREQLLKRAGEDIAARILKVLNLNVPVMR